MGTRIDLVGQKYGRWTVTGFSHTTPRGQTYWHCLCDCGNAGIIRSGHLRSKNHPSTSCGCYLRDKVTKHGYYIKGREDAGIMRAFISYEGMMRRTRPDARPEHTKYYADKGITVTEQRWVDSVDNFIADMGPCPENHSIDRIDNDKGYSKDNCRWATASEQQTNKSNSRVTPKIFGAVMREIATGKEATIIASKVGVDYGTVKRIQKQDAIYCTRPEYLAAL